MTEPKPSPAWQGLRPTGKTRRILVTGSRKWVDRDTIRLVLARLFDSNRTAVLVSGHCPRGADAIAEEIWAGFGGEVELHPADWKTHGKSAGFIRNQQMVNLGADLCLAFPLGKSPGTHDCIRRAENANISVINYGADK